MPDTVAELALQRVKTLLDGLTASEATLAAGSITRMRGDPVVTPPHVNLFDGDAENFPAEQQSMGAVRVMLRPRVQIYVQTNSTGYTDLQRFAGRVQAAINGDRTLNGKAEFAEALALEGVDVDDTPGRDAEALAGEVPLEIEICHAESDPFTQVG